MKFSQFKIDTNCTRTLGTTPVLFLGITLLPAVTSDIRLMKQTILQWNEEVLKKIKIR